MDMNKTNSSIDENEESLVGEVLSDDEVREKKQAIAKWQHSPVGFGSYITKSNDLIQRTKYSLPRNEQKVLFMLMSKIDQKNDKDASKYYSITFNDFAKLTGVRTVDTTYALNLKETIEKFGIVPSGSRKNPAVRCIAPFPGCKKVLSRFRQERDSPAL